MLVSRLLFCPAASRRNGGCHLYPLSVADAVPVIAVSVLLSVPRESRQPDSTIGHIAIFVAFSSPNRIFHLRIVLQELRPFESVSQRS